MADSKNDEEKKADPRMAWIRPRVERGFGNMKADKLKKSFDSLRTKLLTFFSDAEQRALFLYGEPIEATTDIPRSIQPGQRGVYFLKRDAGSIEEVEGIEDKILYGELSQHVLQHLELLLQEVFVPLVTNSGNKAAWGGELASKDMAEMMRALLANVTITYGRTQARTRLPLPPIARSHDDNMFSPLGGHGGGAASKSAGNSGSSSSPNSAVSTATSSIGTERVHMFEGSVVM